jgi:hypothetical protein
MVCREYLNEFSREIMTIRWQCLAAEGQEEQGD